MESYATPAGHAAKAERPSGTKYKLSGLSIEFAQNGFVLECRYNPVRSTGGPSEYKDPTRKVYEDKAGLLKGIADALG